MPVLALQAQQALLDAPTREQPWALLEALSSPPCVQAVNAAAQAAGVQPGMRRATAMGLCALLRIATSDPAREAAVRQAVVAVALAFTPSVALEGERTVLLEVSTTLRLFGGLSRLLARLREALAPLELTIHPGVAATALAAAWRARMPVPSRWGAEPAGAAPDPRDPCTLLDARQASAWIDALPLAFLEPAAEHRAHWQAMGLTRVAELRAQPRDGIVRRFGPHLLLQIDRAAGRQPDPRRWLSLPERFAARIELPMRADSTAHLQPGAHWLLAQLRAWVQARGGRVAAFTLQMHHERRHRDEDSTPESTALPIALSQPSADAAHLRTLLDERLGRLVLPAPTLSLSLQEVRWVADAAPNGELFPTDQTAGESLARLLDRLQARLGPQGVLRPQIVDDHRPERATRWVREEGGSAACASGIEPAAAPGIGALPYLTRPSWLHDPPVALTTREGQPCWQGRLLRLLRGPERIETGWWDEGHVQRDYYVAATAEGALVWIFHGRAALGRPRGEGWGWYLHGRFA